MRVKRVIAAYFSPTGNVKLLAEAMSKRAAEMLSVPLETIDFTDVRAREKAYEFTQSDLVIIGLPVYAGRLPNKILPFVQEKIKGRSTLSIAYVAYGNRAFDDGLSELVYEQKRSGFIPVGAAAFTSQHSFAERLAKGRPDSADLKMAGEFAAEVCSRIESIADAREIGEQTVPGNTPPGPYYRPKKLDGEPAVFLKAKPKTNMQLCDGCSMCAKACPMGSISFEKPDEVTGVCIKCQACITICHTKAKYFDDPDFLSHRDMLEQNFTGRKENTFFVF